MCPPLLIIFRGATQISEILPQSCFSNLSNLTVGDTEISEISFFGHIFGVTEIGCHKLKLNFINIRY